MTLFMPKPVEAISANAETIVRLTYQDLLNAGLDEETARIIADDDNANQIEAQRLRLERHPDQYTGIFALEGSLLGFEKHAPFGIPDDLPFRRGVPLLAERALSMIHMRRLHGNPVGIFALVATEGYGPDTQETILSSLLDGVITQNNTREIRLSTHEDDPVWGVAERKGFVDSGRYGRVVIQRANLELGFDQTLLIRRPE